MVFTLELGVWNLQQAPGGTGKLNSYFASQQQPIYKQKNKGKYGCRSNRQSCPLNPTSRSPDKVAPSPVFLPVHIYEAVLASASIGVRSSIQTYRRRIEANLELCRQILALCITGTNTFSGLLFNRGVSIPAFQIIFNYIALALVYTPITIYKYGFAEYAKMWLQNGWKCMTVYTQSEAWHRERGRERVGTIG